MQSAGNLPEANSPPQPVILLRDLHKTYATDAGAVHAVSGVNLEIRHGDFVAIMGASGSGKSTLMNIIGCLDQPTSGTYLLDGVDVGTLKSDELAGLRNGKLGFVFQGFNLLSRTTSQENVELPLIYSSLRMGNTARMEAAGRGLERVGLGERMEHFPNELSGGQQQRVAIARALVNEPTVLLADEPTGNLDSATSVEIMGLFRELNEGGITIVMVTHELDVAAHARRTVVMRDGKILRDERREPEAVAPPRQHVGGRRPPFGGLSLVRNIFSSSGRALLRNKLRTFLTALGMIIGVAAVIAMVAIGRGASKMVENQIRSMGDNLLLVFSGQIFSGGMYRGYSGMGTLTLDDAEAIRREITGVVAISPEVRSTERYTAGDKNWYGTVRGTSPEYIQVRNWPLSAGSFFEAEDVRAMAPVAVVGQTVVGRMFPDDPDVVGKTLRIGGNPFQIIGVLTKKGAASWGEDQDDVVIIPYTTSMKRVIGTTKLRSINVQIASAELMPTAREETNQILRDRHKIDDPSQDDFSVRTQDEFIQMATQTTRFMTMLLGIIAGISLLVGGIGIMNIMLVSVTERTREIGIRRAVGATAWDIQLQFLVEAVVLSTVGGLIGIGLGVGTAKIISESFGWPVLISSASILISFGVSCAVGIVFGFFPAFKAAGLNPIEALRHE